MSMPKHFFLVRHGESVGNVASNLAKQGDLSHYTDEFVTTPGRTWRLTDKGQAQALLIGDWLQQELVHLRDHNRSTEDKPLATRHYVSPYIRTRQTAGLMGLEGETRPVEWYLNRTIRERDWGDIDSIPKEQFKNDPQYRLNAQKMKTDPLYWRPPGGESIQDVADNRVRNFLETLHRESSDQLVVAVTHGEFMKATRLVLERESDEGFLEEERAKRRRIHNCQVIQYTKSFDVAGLEPNVGSPRLQFTRTITPLVEEGICEVTPWTRIDFHRPTNEELLLGL